MEERIIVLGCVALVVTRVLLARAFVVVVFAVGIVKSGGRQRTRLYRSAESGLTHVSSRLRLLCDQTVLEVIGANLSIAVSVRVALRAESETVCSGARGSIRNSNKCHYGTNDDGGFTGTPGADQRVALVVVWLHAHGRHGKVGAIDSDDCGLGKTGSRIHILDCGMDGYNR